MSERFAVVAFFPPPAARAGVLEPLQKWVCHILSIMSSLTFFNPGALPIFSNGSHTPVLTGGSRKTPLRRQTVRSWRSRASIFTPIENVWRRIINMLMSWEQGGKNPRKIPKFSINHERYSRTIEKNLKKTHALILGYLNGSDLPHQQVSPVAF